MTESNEFDYYLIASTTGGNTPLSMNDDNENSLGIAYLSKCERVPAGHVTYLTFRDPIPRKPDLNVDLLRMDTSEVFSKKVADAFSQKEIKGLQLVPAVVRGKKNQIYHDFYVANVYRCLSSFDKEKTEFEYVCEWTGEWSMIEKIVLDKALLSKTPLADRLVYVSKEHPQFVLYHRSVVDIILSVEPEGLKCIPVEAWGEAMRFEDEYDDDDS